MADPKSDPQPLHVAAPPMPISQMTDAERRAFAAKVYDGMVAAKGD